jgi:hypothetical protein
VPQFFFLEKVAESVLLGAARHQKYIKYIVQANRAIHFFHLYDHKSKFQNLFARQNLSELIAIH